MELVPTRFSAGDLLNPSQFRKLAKKACRIMGLDELPPNFEAWLRVLLGAHFAIKKIDGYGFGFAPMLCKGPANFEEKTIALCRGPVKLGQLTGAFTI